LDLKNMLDALPLKDPKCSNRQRTLCRSRTASSLRAVQRGQPFVGGLAAGGRLCAGSSRPA
jgi:hypothetical protein